jgi:hypothetical protein
MSVLDQLHELEQRVAQRLRELEPMVAEYRELEDVARRLGIARGEVDAGAGDASAQDTARTAGELLDRPESVAPEQNANGDAQGASAPARRRRRQPAAVSKPRTRRKPGTRASAGSRQEDVLRLIRQRPGVTVRDLGQELGVDSTGLYRVVRRLESDGQIRKEGRKLEPADGGN